MPNVVRSPPQPLDTNPLAVSISHATQLMARNPGDRMMVGCLTRNRVEGVPQGVKANAPPLQVSLPQQIPKPEGDVINPRPVVALGRILPNQRQPRLRQEQQAI